MSKGIDKHNVEEILELNMVQKGMLFHHLKQHSGTCYNIQLSFEMTGAIRPDLLQTAAGLVQAANESLRSVFRWHEIGRPVQIICRSIPLTLTTEDLSLYNEEERPQALLRYLTADRLLRFDLTDLPLRLALIRMTERSYIFMVTHHHILYDGWSTGIFLKELFKAYAALVEGRQPATFPKPRYLDICRTLRKNQLALESRSYWLDYLAGYTMAALTLPATQRSGGTTEVPVQQQQRFFVPLQKMEAFARTNNVTLSSVIYAAYGILLQKIHDRDDIVFGITVSNRDAAIPGHQHVIGNFINTVPLRMTRSGCGNFLEAIMAVHAVLAARHPFNNTSYPEIKQWLSLKPAEDLFDSIVVIENYPLDETVIQKAGLRTGAVSVYENIDIPLVIRVYFREELEFDLVSDSIDEAMIAVVGRGLLRIIDSMLEDPAGQVRHCSLVSEAERQYMLRAMNDTDAWYSKEETIVSIFEGQAERTPAHIAVQCGQESLTYRQLDQKAGNIAAFLLDRAGVKTGDLVGVMLEREAWLIPSILGILKAGAAYVPIDPFHPAERIDSIVRDGKLKALITRGHFHAVAVKHTRIIDLNSLSDTLDGWKDIAPPAGVTGKDLAYVIYTSGSTGHPKGVMIEHHSVVNRLRWMQKKYPLTAKDIILHKTPVVFDVSVWELFWWALAGASVSLLRPGGEKDPREIMRHIEERRITTLHFVPSMLNAFLPALEESSSCSRLKDLRFVFASGESLLAGQVNAFGRSLNRYCGTRLINLYGPTEATVDVTYFECNFEEDRRMIPIGRPIDNTRLYILDKNRDWVPAGLPGELYLAGAGLARGYLGNAALTDERFIKDFGPLRDTLYRTGDLARWLPDGNVEFLQRIDHQVKIRGFRIEPGEIEAQLLQYISIRECAVLAKEGHGDKYLTAYYVSGNEISEAQLRAYLAKKIPAYMIPSFFIHLEELPLTSNGKLDRKALLRIEPAAIPSAEEDSDPGEVEEKLLKIWAEVLGKEKIGVHHNFFDVGGDSIKLITVNSKIKKVFNKDIELTELFNHPTISGLADYIVS